MRKGLAAVESIDPSGALGSPVSVVKKFAYQSYFDSVLRERALLVQAQGEEIVSSTIEPRQVEGYGVGLAPWSQTPVAIQFEFGGRSGGAQPVILTPGEVMSFDQPFRSFKWGLPFGWLGGGVAHMFVFPQKDATPAWNGDTEVLFHRTRLIVRATTVDPAGAGIRAPNWPTRFPWPGAVQGANNIAQTGSPKLMVTPTRTVMRLVVANAVLPVVSADMRMFFFGSDDFDVNSVGAIDLTQVGYDIITWPSVAAVGLNPVAQYPILEFKSGPLVRLNCEGPTGGVIFMDNTVANTLAEKNAYVDVCRYGVIGGQ